MLQAVMAGMSGGGGTSEKELDAYLQVKNQFKVRISLLDFCYDYIRKMLHF